MRFPTLEERYVDAATVERLLGGTAAIPQAGDLVDGKYRILGAIGEGGVGTILEAHHELLDKDVALKLIALEPTANTSAAALAERFLVEARAAAKVESPHVARVMDVGTLASGAPFMVMERLEGCNLEELLALEGKLSIEDTVDFVMQALQGLAHAHVLGVVHRDLKPANLFLARQPDGSAVIKIVDFGIAMLLDDAGRRAVSTRLTGSGALVGSPLYMSPEQVRDAEHIDHRTDIWSVGVALHELLTGKVPFGTKAVGLGEIFGAILEEPLVAASSLRADVPKELDAIIARCLSRDVAERYSDVAEIARAIAPFGSGKWNHLVESIEQSFRARLVRMTGSKAFKPMAVEIEMPAEEATPVAAETEPPPAAPTSRKSRGWMLVLLLAVAGAVAWGVHRHLFDPILAWARP